MNTYSISDCFAPARQCFNAIVDALAEQTPDLFEHEQSLCDSLIKLGRELLQGKLDLAAAKEKLNPPQVCVGDRHLTFCRDSSRIVISLFGAVRVRRLAFYDRAGTRFEHPLDGKLGLCSDGFSMAARVRVARALLSCSYDEVLDPTFKVLPFTLARRSMQRLVVRTARDFDAFYQRDARPAPNHEGDAAERALLVLSTDGKGVPMRREGLREQARKESEREDNSPHRYALSPGKKQTRKRMAQVCAVYDIAPFPRSPEDILRELRPEDEPLVIERPRPTDKRLWASVRNEASQEIKSMFDEALRRDPQRKQRWVALVDGNEFQLEQVRSNAKRLGADVTIVIDLLHVSSYLWAAASALHGASSVEAELWTDTQVLRLLRGDAGKIATNLSRMIRDKKLRGPKRKAVEAASRYLSNHVPWLKYDEALTDGLPIATGVIEGGCRYLVKDRMERTGSRWSLDGAEAMLRLRSIWVSADWNNYVTFHCHREARRAREPQAA